jgi:hypothetical protein
VDVGYSGAMSFLYRTALTVTRRQPYIEWARAVEDDGHDLTGALGEMPRTVYLAPESDARPDPVKLLDEFWEYIFDEELAAWMEDEASWPTSRTRDLFDEWFAVEFTDSVFDLVPEEPLTQTDVEFADLGYAFGHCAWCDAELEPDAGRTIVFGLRDRAPFANRAGLTFPVQIREDNVLLGVMTRDDDSAEGDVLFRACTSRCEKAIRKDVPRALRHLRQS